MWRMGRSWSSDKRYKGMSLLYMAMVAEHKCPRCGYKAASAATLKNHYMRKNPCPSTFSAVAFETLKDTVHVKTRKPPPMEPPTAARKGVLSMNDSPRNGNTVMVQPCTGFFIETVPDKENPNNQTINITLPSYYDANTQDSLEKMALDAIWYLPPEAKMDDNMKKITMNGIKEGFKALRNLPNNPFDPNKTLHQAGKFQKTA